MGRYKGSVRLHFRKGKYIMKKKEFMKNLEDGLKQFLNDGEVIEAISYYEELINDRLENGELEEEVIASLGNIDSIVLTISVDSIGKRPVSKNIKSIYKTFISILRLATTPLLLFLSFMYVIVMLVLGIVFFSVFIAFFFSIIAIILSSVDSIIIISRQGGNLWHILLVFGTHLFGVGVLMSLCIGLKNLIYYILNKIIKLFTRTVKKVGV